jgi:hypothetical protein
VALLRRRPRVLRLGIAFAGGLHQLLVVLGVLAGELRPEVDLLLPGLGQARAALDVLLAQGVELIGQTGEQPLLAGLVDLQALAQVVRQRQQQRARRRVGGHVFVLPVVRSALAVMRASVRTASDGGTATDVRRRP